jgi:hypothetical protein
MFIDGVNFVEIDGVKEATNSGFVGEGYANVANAAGSFVTYGVTAKAEGKYTLYISFANGGSAERGFSVTAGDRTLIESGSMESAGGWTTWKTQSVEVELPAGYSELKFTSLSKDGMANIDYIGWLDAGLHAGNVDIGDSGRTVIGEFVPQRATNVSPDRYFVNFVNNGKSAGVYFMRGNGKTFRVNGASR